MPQDRLETAPDAGSLTLVQGSLAEGWTLGAVLTVLTDVEIFGWAKPRRASRAPTRRCTRSYCLSWFPATTSCTSSTASASFAA